ncbi:MAG: WGR domain-containing protein [Desulfobulbus sp.]|jgi:predicted DNA-binding WGR domain protein|nr:WGR domain-containing protein [Desulfobulbus sp.]
MICIEQTYLECIKPAQNKRAYYRLVVGYDLFGPKVMRSWGRIGTKERPRRCDRTASMDEAREIANQVLKTRFAHGYAIIRQVSSPC